MLLGRWPTDVDVDLRTGTHRGGVPRAAHDDHVGARPVQGRPRTARARLRSLPRSDLRGRDRRDRHLDRRAAARRAPPERRLPGRRKPSANHVQRPLQRAPRRDDLQGLVDLTIRGVTRTVPLDVHYMGEWLTPWWMDGESKGTLRRIGFEASARINRHDFGVSWQDEMPGGGVVVSDEIELTIDAEAILLDDLERTGAIDYYRATAALTTP